MFVTKRNGQQEPFNINKIINRITQFNYGPGMETQIVLNLNNRVYSGIPTAQVDNLIAETAMTMSNVHLNYGRLAANILLNNIYKRVEESFSQTMRRLYEARNDSAENGGRFNATLLADDVYEIVQTNGKLLDATIDHANDLKCVFKRGFKVLISIRFIEFLPLTQD